MRIEQNLLHRNLHTNGHQQNNGTGLYARNNNSTTTQNRRNQGKEVGQDIHVRKSALQETENGEKTSFLNPELQRELNRILAEAESDGKLSQDSEDSPSTSSSSVSSASSEEEDEYEHPRRLFLEEIAEEDEEESVDDDEDVEEEEEEEEDEEEISENEDSDEEAEEQVEENDKDGERKEKDLDVNNENNPLVAVDDTGELEGECSDIASDSDATITNECIGEEIETDHEIRRKVSQVSSSVRAAVTKLFNKEQEEKKSEKQARILFKVENDDRKSAVENEWGNEQIDETPKETGAEHARRETGISTETDYQEPVESEQQYSYHQPHCFNHFHKQKYSKQTPQYKQTDETYNTCADADRESVSEVSQQPFEFHHQQQQHKEKQHEHPKELLLDQTQPEENTKSAHTRTTYSVAGQVDEDVENDDDDDEDDDDDDGESSCNSSTISTSSSSSSTSSGSGSSIEALEELEQEQQQKQHGNVEIRLFHDVGSAIASKSTSNNISREWNTESKCRAVLVDLQATTSTEVHELVPESPGESGTGSSSSLSSSASPSFPLKSSLLSSTPINSNCLRSKPTTKKDVSVGDSCTNNTFTRLPLHTIINDNNNSSDSCNTPVSQASTSNTPQNSFPAPLIPPKSFPSILITSPKSSPPTSSTSTGTVAPKKKRVSFQEQVESKTYFAGDEPSSVSSSDSDFSKKEDLVDTNFAFSETKPDLTVEKELNNSSSSHPSYGTTVYNNSQFSTADFWALRNGGRDSSQQKQYLQSLYYSESENSSEAAEYHQLQQKSKQQYRQPITNHHYYYPSEYFTLSDTFAQNSSLGLPPTESASSSACANQSWKTHESKQQQQSNQEQQLDIHSTRTAAAASAPLTTSPTTRPTSVLDNNRNAEMHQRLSGGEQRLRSVLRKPGVGGVKKTRGERSVTFNESLNLFYEAECSCWIHEDDYHRLRQEEQAQQQQHQQQHHQHHQQFIYEQTHPQYPHTHQNFIYEPPPIEFEDPPTLSPPEGYKDRFFPQEDPTDPDVTRVCPPSPPSARRKVFLKENSTDQLPPPPPQQKGVILNGLEDEEEDEESRKSNSGSGNSSSGTNTSSSKGSRLGGILKGGRLWRSNSAEGKKVTSPPDEPDVVKCTERDSRERLSDKDPSDRTNAVSVGTSSPQAQVQTQEPHSSYQGMPTKVSTGTAPLRTSEQIRLAVDSTLRLRTKKTKPECSSLVEKLRWLTSLDDDDPSDSSSQSGFATWPSRDKNGSVSSGSSSKKSDAGTSTNEEFVNSAGIRQPPPIYSSNEAKIKQISYTLEDIDEGLKGSEIELESFITEDGGRIERLKKRYSGEEPGDDYGFSRRPSVKGIKPKFSSTNQIFAQYTAMRASGTETPVPVESQYENTRGLPPPASFDQLPNHLDGARMQLNYEVQSSTTGRPPEESRAHFEMIRQSFEHASFSNFNRPHSWSVSTLPHPHHTHAHSNSISLSSTASPVPQPSGGVPPNLLSNNFGSTLSVSQQPMTQQQQQQHQQQQQQQHQQQQQQQNNLSMNPSPINMNNAAGGVRGADGVPMMAGNPGGPIYGTLPSGSHMVAQQNQMPQPGQPIYGTVRRVPNVIGRPLFLHYGALSVEAHPNKIVQPFPRPTKVPETPSPTQQPPPLLKYYGPPIRYYNSPPPVPPRSVTTAVGGGMGNQNVPGNGVTPSGMGNQTMADCQQERGVPEGATDEEPSVKESYSMNV
ncbi:unnamed protein product [Orchesella dallaii]|uniref:Uncharacterized protein n=1 Tax=Orchesella dallaii TaxID=48710 RepID=A0ABP1QWC3_9HEXA